MGAFRNKTPDGECADESDRKNDEDGKPRPVVEVPEEELRGLVPSPRRNRR